MFGPRAMLSAEAHPAQGSGTSRTSVLPPARLVAGANSGSNRGFNLGGPCARLGRQSWQIDSLAWAIGNAIGSIGETLPATKARLSVERRTLFSSSHRLISLGWAGFIGI